MATVTLKNTSDEALAFTGLPLIGAGQTFEVDENQAEYYLMNVSVKMVEKESKTNKKDESFKAVE